MKMRGKNIKKRNINKINLDSVRKSNVSNNTINTQKLVESIYEQITNNLQKDLTKELYKCITKELHNELINFKNFTEKYLNQRISTEFELIKRDLNLILNDEQDKDMTLDKEEIPSYYS